MDDVRVDERRRTEEDRRYGERSRYPEDHRFDDRRYVEERKAIEKSKQEGRNYRKELLERFADMDFEEHHDFRTHQRYYE